MVNCEVVASLVVCVTESEAEYFLVAGWCAEDLRCRAIAEVPSGDLAMGELVEECLVKLHDRQLGGSQSGRLGTKQHLLGEEAIIVGGIFQNLVHGTAPDSDLANGNDSMVGLLQHVQVLLAVANGVHSLSMVLWEATYQMALHIGRDDILVCNAHSSNDRHIKISLLENLLPDTPQAACDDHDPSLILPS